jgi:ribonuclease D
MKKTDTKKGKLTLKQARLIKALPESNSVAEAGAKAGYADRPSTHRALKTISEKTPEVIERLGLTVEHVVNNCLRPLLEAEETKFFANQGLVMDQRNVAALDIRLRAIDIWAKLKGAYTPQKVQVSGDLNLELMHATDEELDQAIADLTGSPEPQAKA